MGVLSGYVNVDQLPGVMITAAITSRTIAANVESVSEIPTTPDLGTRTSKPPREVMVTGDPPSWRKGENAPSAAMKPGVTVPDPKLDPHTSMMTLRPAWKG